MVVVVAVKVSQWYISLGFGVNPWINVDAIWVGFDINNDQQEHVQ